MNPTEALNQARDHIQSIQQQLAELYAIAPSLGDNQNIAVSLNDNHALFEQAAQQLRHPALRIAMIGTTSSGKSTLVNGLVGRKIAPMEARELSAGVLRLVHAERNRLLIEAPSPAEGQALGNLWSGMDVYDQPDQAMYDSVKEQVFKVFHERKDKHTLPVPRVRIEGPLLPARDASLLQIPQGVGLEIFDLPGLNSTHDRHNLAVIQSYLKQCFSVVVMDYCQTDSENRQKLLKEVKKVVDALGGKTDATLFVLNRVDRRTEQDDPLEERLASFALDIQTHLELETAPDLLPISALPLFYGQCAWGTTELDQPPKTELNQRLTYYRQFRKDCASLIEAKGEADDSIADWFHTRRKAEVLSDEDLRQWLEWCWEWSHALTFWRVLRDRIADRFAEIVIAPTLIQPLAKLNDFLQQLHEYLNVQGQENREAVAAKKCQLEEQFEALQDFLEREHDEFHDELQCAIDELVKAMGSGHDGLIALALNKVFAGRDDGKGTEPGSEEALRRTVQDARSDLVDTIILPIRQYFLAGWPADELRDALGKTLPAEERDQLVKCADRLRARGLADERVELGWTIEAYEDAPNEVERLQGTVNALQALFTAVRKAMIARVGFVLQGRSRNIETAFAGLLERGLADIEAKVQQDLPEVAESLMAKFRDKRAAASPLGLPKQLFEWPDPQPRNTERQEQDGTRTETRETGTCFKSKEKIEVPKYKTRAVRSVTLPGANTMAQHWEDGTKAAEGELWRTLGKWFQDTAMAQRTLFQEAAKEVRAYLLDLYDQRLRQNQEEFERRQAELQKLESFTRDLSRQGQGLFNTGVSGEVGTND